jgi:uncharacterized membrane protein
VDVASLSQAKTLGGIGAILIFIPFVSLIGYILIIVAVRDISQDLQDKTIFSNIVIAAVTGIVGALAGASVIAVGVFGADHGAGAVSVGLGLLVTWIALIISAVFLRRAYSTMSQRLGVGNFRTAATLYFIGAILTIVLIGFILLFVAEILQAIAYFSIPDQPPMQGAGFSAGYSGPAAAPSPSMSAPGEVVKFCTSCGTKISPSATFCYRCGAKQQ